MAGALDGIRVLDFTRYQQGPYATSLLADMGAEVIKVEPRLHGEFGRQSERDESGFSPYFETYNRGKRSITLDIRRPEAREIIERLIPRIDVVVENFRPGVMDKLGLGYDMLRQLNPLLIFAAASAFGSRGPMAARPGYDHIAQAVSGLMVEQAGGREQDPQPALPGAADEISAMLFAYGIACALVARDRTGEGQKVEVSLLGSMMAFQGRQIMRYFYTGKQGRARFRRSPVYAHYQCRDGWGVAIAAQDPKRWTGLCRALQRPDLIDDPRFAGPWDRSRNAAALEEELESIFIQDTIAAWLARLIAHDVPCGAVNDYRALHETDPELAAQLEENGYLVNVESANLGTYRAAGVPVSLSGTPAPPVRPAPELGVDTETILLELGYTWEQMEQLRRDEVI
jgi:CoA:oxalate CoA-transferase